MDEFLEKITLAVLVEAVGAISWKGLELVPYRKLWRVPRLMRHEVEVKAALWFWHHEQS